MSALVFYTAVTCVLTSLFALKQACSGTWQAGPGWVSLWNTECLQQQQSRRTLIKNIICCDGWGPRCNIIIIIINNNKTSKQTNLSIFQKSKKCWGYTVRPKLWCPRWGAWSSSSSLRWGTAWADEPQSPPSVRSPSPGRWTSCSVQMKRETVKAPHGPLARLR